MCHMYISGAPSPDLEHQGKYGPDCESDHHPDPCDYVHREHGACSHHSAQNQEPKQHEFVQQPPASLAPAEEVKVAMVNDNRQLMMSFHKVDTLIRMFPSQLMIADRLTTY